MTTSARRHSRAPLRRSSTPEKILSTGLAAATCVGIVGVIGMRTIDYNASASADTTTPAAAPAQATVASQSLLHRRSPWRSPWRPPLPAA